MMLFPTHIWGGGVDAQQERQYDVAPDGRFLINMKLESAAAPITLLMNWTPEAKKWLRRGLFLCGRAVAIYPLPGASTRHFGVYRDVGSRACASIAGVNGSLWWNILQQIHG